MIKPWVDPRALLGFVAAPVRHLASFGDWLSLKGQASPSRSLLFCSEERASKRNDRLSDGVLTDVVSLLNWIDFFRHT